MKRTELERIRKRWEAQTRRRAELAEHRAFLTPKRDRRAAEFRSIGASLKDLRECLDAGGLPKHVAERWLASCNGRLAALAGKPQRLGPFERKIVTTKIWVEE